MNPDGRLSASFRDPSGFLFRHEGAIYRQIHQSYRPHLEALEHGGLLTELWEEGLLLRHEKSSIPPLDPSQAWIVIRPEPLTFLSHPYEWCFGQLRDAALATLEIQRRALVRGLSLKDASAYNIQFHHGRPVLIDSLSFEILHPDEPWVAYRQFCQHFLAPLALMAFRDVRLGTLLKVFLDGVPLDLASRLLPRRTWARFSLLSHIHLHALSQKRFAGRPVPRKNGSPGMGLPALRGLVASLESGIRSLTWTPTGTPWADYGQLDSYTTAGAEQKRSLVRAFLSQARPSTVWDLGANTGDFSRLASNLGAFTVAWDLDPSAVERNYRASREEADPRLLPLLLDLTNPSPAIGWDLSERSSFFERGPADAVLALALIHHLAIGNNVPLPQLASTLRRVSAWLALEFVPKEDPQVQRLLVSRADIFPNYHRAGLEQAFQPHFETLAMHPIPDSTRTLYWMRAR